MNLKKLLSIRIFTVVLPDRYPEPDTAYHALFFFISFKQTLGHRPTISATTASSLIRGNLSYAIILSPPTSDTKIVKSNLHSILNGTKAQIGPRLFQHTQLYTRIPWDFSALRKGRYIPTNKRKTSVPSAWFEPAILEIKRPQAYSSERTATRIGVTQTTLHLQHTFQQLHYNYSNVQKCISPTCFGLFRPSSGRHSTKKNTIMASYVTDLQIAQLKYQR